MFDQSLGGTEGKLLTWFIFLVTQVKKFNATLCRPIARGQ